MKTPSTRLLTAAEMRAAERAAIDGGWVSGRELMERAGRAVAGAIALRWRPARAVVMCGPGNNGGDGYVVARLLAEQGWAVTCHALGQGDLPPDAAAAGAAWRGPVLAWDAAAAQGADLVVDAVFGAGLTRPVGAEVIAAFETGAPVVAVDAPTGLCMDSGRPLGGRAVRATLTVTFHAPRLGHYLADGPVHCGEVTCADIGLPPADDGVPLIEGPLVPLGKGGGHKYDSGHALILSGGPGKGGAARMAARGALRVGAGLVTLGCPPAALQENAAQLDAIMLRPVRDAAHLTRMLEDARLNALCLGPGFGLGEGTRETSVAALGAGRPTVLDGDALTAFAGDPAVLLSCTHAHAVLTPHAGEFARLFPDLADRLKAEPATGPAYSRLDATREAAARAGCVVLLKGPDTVIAEPGGGAAVSAAAYHRAAPWLATAGSGDVLAGFVTGLCARGFPAAAAAGTAAWLHVECALAFGPGLIAEDLPEALPGVFRGLGL